MCNAGRPASACLCHAQGLSSTSVGYMGPRPLGRACGTASGYQKSNANVCAPTGASPSHPALMPGLMPSLQAQPSCQPRHAPSCKPARPSNCWRSCRSNMPALKQWGAPNSKSGHPQVHKNIFWATPCLQLPAACQSCLWPRGRRIAEKKGRQGCT